MTVRRRTSKHRGHALTMPERMELSMGPHPNRQRDESGGSVFASDDERREVWELVGHTLGHHPGDRPWAFWRYTEGAPGGEETGPQYDDEAEEIFAAQDRLDGEQLRYLAQNGLLEPYELTAILSAAAGPNPSANSLERAAILTEHRGRS